MTNFTNWKPTTEFLENFTKLQKNKILSTKQIKSVNTAIKRKNAPLISMYEKIFESYMEKEKSLIIKFVQNKTKLLHQFDKLSSMIKEQYVTIPLRKKITKTEQIEQQQAKHLLKQLD